MRIPAIVIGGAECGVANLNCKGVAHEGSGDLLFTCVGLLPKRISHQGEAVILLYLDLNYLGSGLVYKLFSELVSS